MLTFDRLVWLDAKNQVYDGKGHLVKGSRPVISFKMLSLLEEVQLELPKIAAFYGWLIRRIGWQLPIKIEDSKSLNGSYTGDISQRFVVLDWIM